MPLADRRRDLHRHVDLADRAASPSRRARRNERAADRHAAEQHQPSRVHRPQGTAVYLTAFSGQCAELPAAQSQAQRGAARACRPAHRAKCPTNPSCRADAPRAGHRISATACIASCCTTASWSSPTCRATSPPLDRQAAYRSIPMRTSYFVGRNSFVGGRPAAAAALAAEAFPGAVRVSPPVPATSSACRPTACRARQPDRDLTSRGVYHSPQPNFSRLPCGSWI